MDVLYATCISPHDRPVLGHSDNGIAGGTGELAGVPGAWGFQGQYDITLPATEDAKLWEGWGTALKPAWEPVLVGRKPG
jgi:hypothetical protein